MMVYQGVLSAVVSALAAECLGSTAAQSWQKLVDQELPNVGSRGFPDRSLVDCWVFARLHSALIPRHWNALVARYSTHKGRKVSAIGQLAPIIASPAPKLFVYKAVTSWAIPQLKGVDGRRSSDMIVLPAEFYDMSTWDPEGSPERTRRRWRKGVVAVLEEMEAEALQCAEAVLIAEGLLISQAA